MPALACSVALGAGGAAGAVVVALARALASHAMPHSAATALGLMVMLLVTSCVL